MRAWLALREQGVESEDKVAILSRNSHAFAAVRFALARMGAVIVPINFMLNAQEIAAAATDANLPASSSAPTIF